ncbi:MAG: hypothetical protein P1P84_21235 [Deferrisomatales bacterium]|nr:hypothetical protein [Deferrisomatales bacterium]
MSLGIGPGISSAAKGGKAATKDQVFQKFNKVTPAEQKAAAQRAKDLGLQPAAVGIPIPGPGNVEEGPGGVPHYFGPYGNWAFSPLPRGAAVVTVTDVGTGYVDPVVTIDDAYGDSGAQISCTFLPGALALGDLTVDPACPANFVAPVVTITDSMPGPGTGAAATAALAPSSIDTIAVDLPGTGYSNPVVTITDAAGTGTGATATATVDGTGAITGITVDAPGADYTAPVVTITDDLGGPGTGATATATLAPSSIATIAVDLSGSGYLAPLVTIADATGTGAAATATVDGTGAITAITVDAPGAGYTAPTVTITDAPVPGPGTGAMADAGIVPDGLTGIQKFVDPLKNIPLAVPDVVTYPGSDYYEIALRKYVEQLHSQLPATTLLGYVQLNSGTANVYDAITNPTGCVRPGDVNPDPTTLVECTVADNTVAPAPIGFLGPTVVGESHRPVRFWFQNQLPVGPPDPVTGARPGDLFIPVDETIMGSGLGPALPGTAGETFTQNRASVHLHGNNTVWISDGTPHQWITPAGETTSYPQGVSVRNVPDMDPASVDSPTDGTMTLYYTNAMSARLMFYHDHALGITRLNVYAGQAAGYLLTDVADQDMINGTNESGVNPDGLKVLPGLGIPLVIQDRTFVDPTTIFAQDPTWNWGTGARDANGNITEAILGDLWYPHVYMTVQNPWDLTGTNAFGRWHYGSWFNPPVPECVNGLPVGCIEVGPVPNEYYQPVCDGLPDPVNATCTAPWEPPMRPGVPNPSMPGESFLDTPVVNGAAYPYLDVEPKAYRFRILNAANDRFFNLQLYVAADKNTPTTPGTVGTTLCDGAVPVADCTEVKMVPVSVAPANQFADTPSGIPDPTTAGPPWIQIGTEGGWLPAPVVVPQQPIGWNVDMAFFNFGVVNQHSIFLGSAERADVVVDFSAYAGKTLILYNDAPAPVPAGAAPYDHYTGDGNQMDAGGPPNTLPGYGPNTRTIMQIRVADLPPAEPYDLAALEAVFAKKTGIKTGVFEVTQDPIIIPQAAYDSAYDNTLPATAAEQYIQIADSQKTFQPIDAAGVPQAVVTMPLEMKAMHDEMGGVYDTLHGRMTGMLGLSLQNSPIHVLVPYPYSSPPTEVHAGSVAGSQIGVLPDGTQIWRIFHNGVDTHPVHVHLFNAQLVNRLGQDGALLPPDPTELGWKDTFRINPLEIIYLAMRPAIPTVQQLPFEVPDSVRLIDPSLPEGATLLPPAPAGWFDPAGNPIPEILNHYVNFGWEYVWHCHILSHEEMDMMHSLVAAMPPWAPTGLIAAWNGSTVGNRRVTLNWTDTSLKEAGFAVQRATNDTFTTGLTTFNVAAATALAPSTVVYTDTTVEANTRYWYRVYALGSPVGDVQTAGFPTTVVTSVSGTVSVDVGIVSAAGPAAPTALAAAVEAGPQALLSWTDNAADETGFVVERCTGLTCSGDPANFALIATVGPRTKGSSTVTYVDATVTAGNSYSYRVAAVNAAGTSAYTNIVAVSVPAIPTAPTGFTVSVVKAGGKNYTATLNWASGVDPSDFTIERATNLSFTTDLNTSTVAGTLRTATQTVKSNTTYYFRIRANNIIGGSSAWANALPFPIRTGP